MSEDHLLAVDAALLDLQRRVAALEAAPPGGGRPDDAGVDLLGLAVKAVTALVKAAADTKQQQQHPTGADGGAGGSASRVRAAVAAAERATAATADLRRTAARRPHPAAPVRLWNAEHTDHLDITGRAASGGVGGVQRIRIADKHAGVARAWLTGSVATDENVFVAWMDREWTLDAWSFGPGGNTLDLLPIPKPPRVDQVLGREPYAGPFPDLQAGDRIGVEHPDTGEVTTHEFSGDPTQPVAAQTDAVARAAEGINAIRSNLRAVFPDLPSAEPDVDAAPEAYTLPDGIGLGTVPEYSQPVGTVTSGLIHATPEKLSTTSDIADLYQRLDHIHDAVDTEDEQ